MFKLSATNWSWKKRIWIEAASYTNKNKNKKQKAKEKGKTVKMEMNDAKNLIGLWYVLLLVW